MQAAEHNFRVQRGDDANLILTHETDGEPDAAALAGSLWVLFIAIPGEAVTRIETTPQGADINFPLPRALTARLPPNRPVPYRVQRQMNDRHETWVLGTITGEGDAYGL